MAIHGPPPTLEFTDTGAVELRICQPAMLLWYSVEKRVRSCTVQPVPMVNPPPPSDQTCAIAKLLACVGVIVAVASVPVPVPLENWSSVTFRPPRPDTSNTASPP